MNRYNIWIPLGKKIFVVYVEKAMIILVVYTYYQEIWGLEATSLRIVVKTH